MNKVIDNLNFLILNWVFARQPLKDSPHMTYKLNVGDTKILPELKESVNVVICQRLKMSTIFYLYAHSMQN